MKRVRHSWLEAYLLAVRESDSSKLFGRIEYALTALDRRYAEWGSAPGTPAELKAIQKCIVALERLMKERQLGTYGMVAPMATGGTIGATGHRMADNRGPIRGSLLIL
jgi:hypothetical protein